MLSQDSEMRGRRGFPELRLSISNQPWLISCRSCCADRRRGFVRLISMMVELGVIVGGLGFETEARCRDLAALATTSISDPAEALRLQEELTAQFSLLSYGTGLGLDISPQWDELLDLVESVRCASLLN